ncbi:DNA/RNA non-specific endonuclease [Paenibacillus sp. TY11]|uniref:DNA/RNA non-specific endonuclease n=1 Tax=Paenibacillus sp. TY11 TaxID=3448633 RepID=UPI004039B200
MSILTVDEKTAKQAQEQSAMKRYVERIAIRERNLVGLQTKTPVELDNPDRVASRKEMIQPGDEFTLERLIGRNDLFPFHYLEKGIIAGKPVCRIVIHNGSGREPGHGTGFLVTPQLLLTNNHVLRNPEIASMSLAQFDYEQDINFNDRVFQQFRLAPEIFFMTDSKLDFTLVAVQERSAAGKSIQDYGFLPLVKQTGKILLGEYVSIIQHPEGHHKAVVIRENKITDMLDNFIHYTADTCEGSSGSAVFSDDWKVIALHHASVPDPDHSGKFIANEGTRISSILNYIEQNTSSLSEQQKTLIKNLSHNVPIVSDQEESMVVGEPFNLEWFEGSTGHDPAFLGDGQDVPHPKLSSALARDVAKLDNGENILNYTHFSIVMSKSRRLAFYTVVNIDGKQSKDAERDDNWRYDPRIDESYQCGNELYKRNKVDKGHLVRRRDPIWGTNSEEANKDTFHFTNCAPQHCSFNQSSNLWLGLEDYLLNHAKNNQQKMTVFTGPIFRENDIVYRGVQIPEEFWKVAVVVKDNGERSTTAYLVSQKPFLNDLEADVPGAFMTFQVKVSLIEGLTGLDFNDLRNYDPLERQEATIGNPIERLEDIQL